MVTTQGVRIDEHIKNRLRTKLEGSVYVRLFLFKIPKDLVEFMSF